ncbi:hypothetical protein ABZ953_34480 [Streptomyces sp. NPDC046465]|uniref:hypothetical protein n=1 Tax=Streptomyces sp. NPDC046465 TaxID=3155810 RepID=UPI003411C808
MGDNVWLMALTYVPVLGTMAAALAYRVRERARWAAVVAVLRLSPGGTRVRFRTQDAQGRAMSEWEITVPAAGRAGVGDERYR